MRIKKLLVAAIIICAVVSVSLIACKSGHSRANIMDQFRANINCRTTCVDNTDRYTDSVLACMISRLSVEAVRRQMEDCHGDGACLAEINQRLLEGCKAAYKKLLDDNRDCVTKCDQLFETGLSQ